MSGKAFVYESLLTTSFQAIGEGATQAKPEGRSGKARPHVVVLGGGHGASLSIRTLLTLDVDVTAVVAMADDGGSTGIIRKEAHVAPPGDIRKCLGAMAADQQAPLTRAFRYRFEFARNHTLGNLILSALTQETGSFPEAIRICEELLGTRGHVYPSTLDNVRLGALDIEGNMLDGQAAASHSSLPLTKVWLVAPEGCKPYSEALDTIRTADVVILGPGSLFTSVVPNLLVPGVIGAIRDSGATTVFVCNVADRDGETQGMRAREHVEMLLRHGMAGLLHIALLHRPDNFAELAEEEREPVFACDEDIDWVRRSGTTPIVRDFSNPEKPELHNPRALQRAFREIIETCRSPRR